MRKQVMAFVSILLLATTTACGGQGANGDQDEYVVGYIAPLSGSETGPASTLLNSAKLAVEQANEEGGVLGRKVVLKVTDGACDPQTGANAANKLVSQGVDAMIAGWCSSVALVAQPIASRADLPFIALSSSPKLVTGGYENTFVTSGTATNEGPTLDFIAFEIYKAKKLAMVDDQSAYAKDLTSAALDAGEAQGRSKSMMESVSPKTNDFGPLISKLRSNGVDTVIWTGYYAQAATLMKQANAQGYNPHWAVGDSNVATDFLKSGGSVAQGIYGAAPPSARFFSSADTYTKAYQDAFSAPPSGSAVLGYDGLNVLLAGVKEAHSVDSKKVIEAISGLTYQGATGMIQFKANGDRESAPYPVVISRGMDWPLADEQPPALEHFFK